MDCSTRFLSWMEQVRTIGVRESKEEVLRALILNQTNYNFKSDRSVRLISMNFFLKKLSSFGYYLVDVFESGKWTNRSADPYNIYRVLSFANESLQQIIFSTPVIISTVKVSISYSISELTKPTLCKPIELEFFQR